MALMEISILLAKFWGILLVIFGLLFLVRKKALDDLFELTKDRTFVIISGYLALILGLVTVILHNIWVADWRVVITIFGWISLIKGIVRLGFPEGLPKWVRVLKNKPVLIKVLLVIITLLGAWLIRKAFA